MYQLNNLDVIILVVITVSALIALNRGLIKEVLSIVGWFLSTAAIIYLLPICLPFAKKFVASGLFAGIIAGVIFAIMGHGITGLALIGCGLASIGVSIFFFYLGKVLAILSKNIVLGLKEYFLKGRA